MKRVLLTVLLGLTALILLALVALGVVLARVNPNDYKDDITALVEKATGKHLIFQSNIEAAFFPRLGLKIGRLQLNDEPVFGAEPFASVQSASLSLELLPLLSGNVVVKDVTLDGLTLKLVATSAGAANWDFNAGKPEAGGKAAPREGVTALADERTKEAKPRPEEGKSLNLAVKQMRCTNMRVTYRDLSAGSSYRLDIDDLALQNLDLGADMSLVLAGSGEDLSSGRAAKFALQGDARVQADGSLAMTVSDLNVSAAAKEASLSLKLALEADYAAPMRTLDLKNIRGSLDSTTLAGNLILTLPPKGAPGDGPRGMNIHGALDIGDLDADRLIAAVAAISPASRQASGPTATPAGTMIVPGRAGQKTAEPAKSGRLDPALAALDADLAVTARSVTAAKLPFKDVRVRLSSEKGSAKAPYDFKLFGGTVKGTALAGLSANPPKVALDAKAEAVPVGDVLAAVSGKRSLTGDFSGELDASGQGLSWKDMAPTLAGKGRFAVVNGRATGFSLIPQGLPGLPAVPVDFPVERVSASLNISKGVAVNRDFSLLAPVMTGSGGGEIDLVRERVDLLLNFLLGGLPPAVPVEIRGPFPAISYKVDTAALLKNTATGVLNAPEAAGKALIEAPKGAGKALEGLFKK